jgi:citrate lyase subunit beta/citryl-CoA lyase
MTRWRSLQYVPAHVGKYVGSPHIAAADAIILDLEDSVPETEKEAARAAIDPALTVLRAHGSDILVRINAEPDLLEADIAAAVRPGVVALVAPKCRNADQMRRLDERMSRAERSTGLAEGSTGLFVLIETADGFLDMRSIAEASPRVLALGLGNEDFATDVGMVPDDETLAMPRQQLAIVAAACGVAPLGLMGLATDYGDLTAYRRLAERSRRFGFVGSTCVHPSQISILNEVFSPSDEEIAWARRVVAAASDAQANGRGAAAIDGRMIDAPIVARARKLLASVSSTNDWNDQTSL